MNAGAPAAQDDDKTPSPAAGSPEPVCTKPLPDPCDEREPVNNCRCPSCSPVAGGAVSEQRLREARGEVREWLDCTQVTIDLSRHLPSLRGVLETVVAGLDELLRLRSAERENERGMTDGKQAHIDALMLEYCPDEMTAEQLENWGRRQKRVSKNEEEAIQRSLK